jgi:hypothetical protein
VSPVGNDGGVLSDGRVVVDVVMVVVVTATASVVALATFE